mmetsp:Transcript_23323/g.47604  ORF Transcript_23323/g.47604 Transcript_23323/m.47604 type:complete len:353 (-) Transcript_23323:999-2057(-)
MPAICRDCWNSKHRCRRYGRRGRFFYCSVSVAMIFSAMITRYTPTTGGAASAMDTTPGSYSDRDTIFPHDVAYTRKPTKRIVGGRDAPKNRYPYFVSLYGVHNGTHKCAGSLVAPDIVMTAAHCQIDIKYAQVGKYYVKPSSAVDVEDDYTTETFEVVGPLHPHPLYNSGVSFSYDALLLKLDRKSRKQYVRINTDPNVPSINGGGSDGGGSSSSGSTADDLDPSLYTVVVHVRVEDGDEESGDDEDDDKPAYRRVTLTGIPRRAFLFEDLSYTQDLFLPNAFRHPIGIPDDIFPEAWKNVDSANQDDDIDYDPNKGRFPSNYKGYAAFSAYTKAQEKLKAEKDPNNLPDAL